MADELHKYITGTLWHKLSEDVSEFRVFNHEDLTCAAYFHIRRVLPAKPGWSCRASPPLSRENQPPLPAPDLALHSSGKLTALIQLEFHVSPGMSSGFPTAAMNERMASVRRAIEEADPRHGTNNGRAGRGYLLAVYAAEDEWFYPEQAIWDRQSCFWLPINCRAFADYSEWRQKWERLACLSDR